MTTQLGTTSTEDIITAVKFLDDLPIGSVIRNSCSTNAVESIGVYFIKELMPEGDRWEWCVANSLTHARSQKNKGGYAHRHGINVFRAEDLFLPVQVVRRGPDPEPAVEMPYLTRTDLDSLIARLRYNMTDLGDLGEVVKVDYVKRFIDDALKKKGFKE